MNEERYSRQTLLDEVGTEGQCRLKNAKVLIVGLGGLGCPVAQYLCSSGIGYLGLADGDQIELSNLARQTLYGQEDVGKSKVETAASKLRMLNNEIELITIPSFVNQSNAKDLVAPYDLVIDCTDNYQTRYALSDATVHHKQALVFAALYKWEGQIGVLNHKNGPSYRDLFPDENAMNSIPNCVEVGVISTLTGIIGSMQANEAIKVILGLDQVLNDKLLTFNALNMITYLSSYPKPAEYE